MYTLVIIDMQYCFAAAKTQNIKSPILREIKLAQKHKNPIIVVEYKVDKKHHNGCTVKYITKATGGRTKVPFIKKKTDDGSMVIIDAIKTLTRSRRIRIVGVNTGQCVKDTVNGLVWNGYKPQIVGDACNSYSYENHRFGLLSMKKSKVKILRLKKGLKDFP